MHNLISHFAEHAWIAEGYIVTHLWLVLTFWYATLKDSKINSSLSSFWYFNSQEPNASKVWQMIALIKTDQTLSCAA